MKSLGTSAHIETDTRFRVTPFADRSHPFVSLRIEGDFVEIALIAALGTSETLRRLAAAAIEAAGALDAMATDTPEVTGRV
ncbi:hypothetical protein CP966_12195 [Streptomyces galilaeus]|uniref:hypothetical protein n=1 Tax=Streptomyces galilaeus TaxID=33899 RepID=UPI00123DCF20|nr:hypothetical protein [Streptomyces galilaeus]QEU65958.1 hypothetical protein CP966_12195 [Streptomyces galilaeus]GGW64845.1 hypothetical protein GCM10010350_56760 [Streptomyces galilaeus]